MINVSTEDLFQKRRQKIFRQTDRMFAMLMMLQWLASVVIALWISPKTWSGGTSAVHVHVWLAIFFGGAISGFPVFLAIFRPGETFTRFIIATSQMLMSSLLIHLMGGRIEAHFHVFGSLAFLSIYRDWRVFVPAVVVVAADHILRGLYWPQSVYGVNAIEPWRWLEHSGWVVFETAFLLIATRRSVVDMWFTARRSAEIQNLNLSLEERVLERTDQLANANHALENEIEIRKQAETQLVHQALHDPLTSLANRVLFVDRLKHALGRIEREKNSVAVLFLDLDNFKTINDTLGHAAGDELLISVAHRVTKCLRTTDTVARLGGDEFAILIEGDLASDGAIRAAERIKESLQKPFSLAGKEKFVGTSIGIADATHEIHHEELLRNADAAMYVAKNGGKGSYSVFEKGMSDALVEKVALEADLLKAFEKQQFVLHYQPIVNLNSGIVSGMEALVRWNHPTKGLLGPDHFVPLAEDAHLIELLGKWVLDEACRQGAEWQNCFEFEKDITMTVNVSGKQFRGDELVRNVAEALRTSGLPARSLTLEITESTMTQNTDATMQKLKALKDLGVKLAIDDFGTGYSSLSSLQRFDVDALKIDRSFVSNLGLGQGEQAVAKAIITMSASLQLETIAEGVETAAQTDALKEMGCGFGQGYHFARPLCPSEMELFLSQTVKVRETVVSPIETIHHTFDPFPKLASL